MIMLVSKDFRDRDIYIDYPYEHAKLRWEKETGKVYRRFNGKREVLIDHTSDMFNEAIAAGREIDRDAYFADYPSRKIAGAVSRLIRLLKP